jgi:hypothetical protein
MKCSKKKREVYKKFVVTKGGKTCIFTTTLLNFNVESCGVLFED